MEKRNLYLIVAIVVVLALVLGFSNLTGRVSVTKSCTDTDGGEEVSVKGTVTQKIGDNENSYTDECFSVGTGPEKYLKEYYCLDTVTSDRWQCSEGCVDGVCLGEATPMSD